jgi:predicted DNA-binding transcriptional regulator AlpA
VIAGEIKMSLEHSPARQQRVSDQYLSAEDLRVLSLKDFAAMMGLSLITVKRLIAAGEGPPLIQLSKRRVGVRLGDARRWQESRMR